MLKLLCLNIVSFAQICLHLTFYPCLSSQSYSSKYEKLPNVLTMHASILQKKTTLSKMCGPQIWLCLFVFQPITLKQLNSSTSIDTSSCLGGLEVTHRAAVWEVPDSISDSGKDYRIVLLLFWFYFFVSKSIICRDLFCDFLSKFIFSILNILQNMWPIIRASRYKPSIFNAQI